MNEYSIRCTDCDWEGTPEELVSETDSLDDRNFCCCPRCNGKNIEDTDYDDDDEM